MSASKLIVGLGNPGKDYEYTRHNFGFMAVARFAKEKKIEFHKSSSLKGLVGKGSIEGQDIFLLLPMTFMNHSGLAVKEFLKQKNIVPENMLVVCDDLDLLFGQMRVRPSGSDGGHNGLTSIIECLETKDFPRLRLGLGRPNQKDDVVSFVLSTFNAQEKKELNAPLEKAVLCCMSWLTQGMTKTMSKFN